VAMAPVSAALAAPAPKALGPTMPAPILTTRQTQNNKCAATYERNSLQHSYLQKPRVPS